MKKQIIITIFTALIFSSGIVAQQYRVNFSRVSYSDYDQRKEVRELQKFEHHLDQFSYLIMIGDLWQASKSKAVILHLMEKEVSQTEKKINVLLRGDRLSKKIFRRSKYDQKPSIYTKRNGYEYGFTKEINRLIRHLELQESLMYKFEDAKLRGGSKRVANKNDHRRIMYKFRDTMKREIEIERSKDQMHGRERRG